MVARAVVLAARTRTRASARSATDDAAVRRYLRALIGAPLSASDSMDEAEASFVDVARRWSERTGVDRRALLDLGVNRRVLDAAGVRQTPINEVLRRYWPEGEVSASDLARRSGFSEPTVRKAIARDEEAGLLKRAPGGGRAVQWERTG